MNKIKTSNPVRSIAFFLVGVLLLCTFGFTVDGWQIKSDDNISIYPPENDDATINDQNTPQEPDIQPPEPEIYIPEYTNPLTGVECSADVAGKIPLGFVLDYKSNLYGINNSQILVEVPTENGQTKFLSFIQDTSNLWKIGSISSTRGYISNIVKYFCGAEISSGSDDNIQYDSCNLLDKNIDLSEKQEYAYTEQDGNLFTNKDLIDLAITSSTISTKDTSGFILPYSFLDFGSILTPSESNAEKISIFYSDQNLTELIYNSESGMYSIRKNEGILTDSLNENSPEFKNCFVLFADSATYETAEYSQMIMSTTGSGKGFYISEGFIYEIKWSATTAGVMTFYSSSGEKLVINRGTIYIAYVKSSQTKSVVIT